MNNIYKIDPWKIVEESFDKEKHEMDESIFSIGNGIMGQRANFEENYSGNSLQGNYIAGVFFPDKTKVGWWKNGYPDYFAKVLNAPSWIDIDVTINSTQLDIANCKVLSFYRELDMQHGILSRTMKIELPDKKELTISSQRFISIVNKHIGAISFSIIPENFDATIQIELSVDVDVCNEDSNYGESFWDVLELINNKKHSIASSITKETPYNTPRFSIATGMCYELRKNDTIVTPEPKIITKEKYVSHICEININKGEHFNITKYGSVTSSLFFNANDIVSKNMQMLNFAKEKGYTQLLNEHKKAWLKKWETSDIEIKGDVSAQQAIRFNIFHLMQTYSGDDPRFNIGPKGFTGEKYGGSTYWDTEAFCFPFYLSTSNQEVPRNLLLYRYKHLANAIKNASKLGFTNGAALFPMVTMTGEECHNEWEITFEEIHRNGAIAHAVYEYVEYTGDTSYIEDYGLELLVGIARFWSQRATFSEEKQKYVILGVTGPNEYENNVNNNWYTNYFARWCLKYAIKSYKHVAENSPIKLKVLSKKISLQSSELTIWEQIADTLYLPYDAKRNIFVQQDGFFDKQIIPVDELDKTARPINQHWSWDRILRSCYIKQADVVQGLYVFEDDFDKEIIKRNFRFYEPITVHESSLSPSIHSVVASGFGDREKAYELYLRTARLDLDDYNAEAHEGLHITSMAGTWLSIVKGFAGFRVKNGKIHLSPCIPAEWDSIAFSVLYVENRITIKISKAQITIRSQKDLSLFIKDDYVEIKGDSDISFAI